MLKLIIPKHESYDENTQRFIVDDSAELVLEHSLVSLSKWESKHKKPFLSKNEKHKKTDEELIDYVYCMVLSPEDPSEIIPRLTLDQIKQINAYIEDPYTATTLPKKNNSHASREIITSELIYYWMISLNVPYEFETWHLNRLITLIEVINVKTSKPKKRSMAELRAERRALNSERRAAYGTSG